MLFSWFSWFSIMNFIVLSAIVTRYLKYNSNVDSLLAKVYIPLAITGHISSILLLVFLLFFLPLILVLPKRGFILASGVIVGTLGCTAILIDLNVYSQYRFHINSMVITLIIGGGREIFDFSLGTYLFGVMCIAAIVAMEILLAFLALRLSMNITGGRIQKGLAMLVLLSILSSHFIHAWADSTYYRSITSITRHIPLYQPLKMKRFLSKHGFVDLADNWGITKLNSNKSDSAAIHYPLHELTFAPHSNKPNIVYILIDSWRFDTLTSKITPHLYSFINTHPTQNFTNHTSGGNGTRVGIFSLFYGIFGSNWSSVSSEQIGPVFIKYLLKNKYQMGIFASAKLTRPAFNQTVFHDIENLRSYSQGDSAWERDMDITTDWKSWFAKRDTDKPFFSFLFYDSPHAYTYPDDYEKVFEPVLSKVHYHKLNNDFDPAPYFNRYKRSVHYVDSLVKKILDDLEKADILDNTLIVISGDHGQEFNDNRQNFWGHGSNYTKYQINVPFVIYWPGKEEKTFTHASSHMDLSATLLTELFGCKNPISDYSNGRNLFDSSERKWLYLGGASSQAIVEPDRITVTFPTGNYDIVDLKNRLLEKASLRLDILKETIQEMSKFYKQE